MDDPQEERGESEPTPETLRSPNASDRTNAGAPLPNPIDFTPPVDEDASTLLQRDDCPLLPEPADPTPPVAFIPEDDPQTPAEPIDSETVPHALPDPVASRSPFPQPFGDYELLDIIARGGMGVVYKARHRKLQRIVAVKTMLAVGLAITEEIQRFHL